MENEELCYLPAVKLARQIAQKKISPIEVVKAIFSSIHRLNPRVNAFCTLAEEEAGRAAKEAEGAVMRGEPLGPLHGVPVSIKDLVLTQGIRTTFGSKLYERFIPKEDEIAVKRLKAAGAIILGKTNTCEFGYKAVTDNLLFGPTRNPWNLERTAGGSSGGAGAAVACGLGPLALGSDAGGSIRVPASFCGVFGFKPTQGRIPIFPVPPGWETVYRRVVHLGPITRTVADAALMMEAMAGPDDRDRSSKLREKISYRRNLRRGIGGLRMAWNTQMGEAVVAPEIRRKLERVLKGWEERGWRVDEVKIDIPSMHAAYQSLFAADCAVALGDRLEKWSGQMDRGLVRLIQIGQTLRAVDYSMALRQVYRLEQGLLPLFAQYDLLLTPTLPLPPFPIGIDWPREIGGQKTHPLNCLAFTYPFNLTGQPAASVPCEWTGEGLPIGLQIVGRWMEDQTVLQVAAALEEMRPWGDRRPNLIP